uniref:Dinitrogenase iron-molybdenum cofactor biosynthesis domain-containing protein n=1 Tax=Chlorobium chlorochromatii (strain CaD3) TaxID=340177 RepID=Q3AR31_CHLCH
MSNILVPLTTANGRQSIVSEHFGSAPYFAVVESESGKCSIIENGGCHHPQGECSHGDVFAQHQATVLLCKGIGGRAASRVEASGVAIYVVPQANSLDEALQLLQNGSLQQFAAGDACRGHNCH